MDIEGEIRAWCDEHVIGARPLDENMKRYAEDTVRMMIARRLDVSMLDVHLLNPRWESTTFIADGFTFPYPTRIDVSFTLDTESENAALPEQGDEQ